MGRDVFLSIEKQTSDGFEFHSEPPRSAHRRNTKRFELLNIISRGRLPKDATEQSVEMHSDWVNPGYLRLDLALAWFIGTEVEDVPTSSDHYFGIIADYDQLYDYRLVFSFDQ